MYYNEPDYDNDCVTLTYYIKNSPTVDIFDRMVNNKLLEKYSKDCQKTFAAWDNIAEALRSKMT